jgi:xanthine dehydrogenase small subunit
LLRDRLGLRGTKEGCAEGDCGACTVIVSDSSCADGMRIRAVDSCLLLAPMLQGRHLWTVEGLAQAAPHPVQLAVERELASQCGYCTPGIVMSLVEASHRDDLRDRDGQLALGRIDDQLCGNLCRCTGYRSIRAAAATVAGLHPADVIATAVAEGCPDVSDYRYQFAEQCWFAPTEPAALWDVLAEHPAARLIHGGTDLGLDVTLRGARFPCLVSLEHIAELRMLAVRGSTLYIGAGAPLSDVEAWAATALPLLARALRWFGSRQIKHRATAGGNLCTASPIGDLAPVLLALDAVVIARSRSGERAIPLAEFFTGYRRTALMAGEVLWRLEIERPDAAARLGCYKVSRRRELDISTLSAAFRIELAGDRVALARLAYGGMAATPLRAYRLEQALIGQLWNEDTLEAALPALAEDTAPIDDHRGSARYRAQVAANLVRGFLDETRDVPFRELGARPLSPFAEDWT